MPTIFYAGRKWKSMYAFMGERKNNFLCCSRAARFLFFARILFQKICQSAASSYIASLFHNGICLMSLVDKWCNSIFKRLWESNVIYFYTWEFRKYFYNYFGMSNDSNFYEFKRYQWWLRLTFAISYCKNKFPVIYWKSQVYFQTS